MDGNTATYLPHEIIENILSRLPVKSLLQFKSVCKQWKATISDPKFAQTHLQISKNSSSLTLSCILRNPKNCTLTRSQLVSFENNEFRWLPAVGLPPLKTKCFHVLCHCDGLYIISYVVGRCHEYALWNPSRRSCKKLNQHKFNRYLRIFGICYDPLINDYKVVISDAKHFAVFYCRKNRLSDLKKMNLNLKMPNWNGSGTPLKGSIYWVSCEENGSEYEIVCFDGKDEKWKNLGKIGIPYLGVQIELISSGEGLYLFHYNVQSRYMPIKPMFMKKVGESEWMELNGELPAPGYECGRIFPVLCGHENKLLIRHSYGDYAVIYDVSERSFARVECSWNSILTFDDLFPYHENMFWD